MAATYKGLLTNNGKALIASATTTNKINYSHIAVGDGNGSVPTPLETRTALVNEKARIALNVVEINPNNTNQIVCEAIIPTTTGGFYIRELGLYAGSTMVVNASYPPTYKPLADEGGAREIALKLVINIQNADVIALYLDDSLIYATREWVDTNYLRRNELVDNLTTSDATKPVSAKQAKNLQDNKLDKSALNNTLTSASETEAATAAMAKKLNDEKLAITSAFGVGQTNQDVTSSRVANTTYTNSSGKTRFVMVTSNSGNNISVVGYVNEEIAISSNTSSSYGIRTSITFPVPPNSTYKVTGSFSRWVEY